MYYSSHGHGQGVIGNLYEYLRDRGFEVEFMEGQDLVLIVKYKKVNFYAACNSPGCVELSVEEDCWNENFFGGYKKLTCSGNKALLNNLNRCVKIIKSNETK